MGPGTLGWTAAAKRREKGGPCRKCLSAAGRAGAIGTRGTSDSGLAFATAVGTLGFPRWAAQRPPDSSGCPGPKDRDRPGLPRH